MSIAIEERAEGKIFEIEVSGKLEKEDYAKFVPEVEKRIEEHGKVRILMVMRDFKGWKVSALWEDIKFDWKHWNDIERLAMVGDKAWQKGMSVFCKPFTSAKIRFFEPDDIDEARTWLE